MWVMLIVLVRVSDGRWGPVIVGKDAGEAGVTFDAVSAGWLVAGVAGLCGWVFAARVALVHVALAFGADEGVKAIEARGQVAVGASVEVSGNGAHVTAGWLRVL